MEIRIGDKIYQAVFNMNTVIQFSKEQKINLIDNQDENGKEINLGKALGLEGMTRVVLHGIREWVRLNPGKQEPNEQDVYAAVTIHDMEEAIRLLAECVGGPTEIMSEGIEKKMKTSKAKSQ